MSDLDKLKKKIEELDAAIAPRLRHLDQKTREVVEKFLDESKDFWKSAAKKVDHGGSAGGKVEHDYPGTSKKREK